MFKFKLLAGRHDEPDRTRPQNAHGRHPRRIYREGEVVETDVDLAKRFNVPGYPPKFAAVEEPAERIVYVDRPVPAEAAGAVATADIPSAEKLSEMSLAELRQFAEDEEIDVDGATTKSTVIRLIRASLAGVG